jgi:hypothetical protein
MMMIETERSVELRRLIIDAAVRAEMDWLNSFCLSMTGDGDKALECQKRAQLASIQKQELYKELGAVIYDSLSS